MRWLGTKRIANKILIFLALVISSSAYCFDPCWDNFLELIKLQPISAAELNAATYQAHALVHYKKIIDLRNQNAVAVNADFKATDLKLSNFGVQTGESGATNIQILEVEALGGQRLVMKTILSDEFSELEDSTGSRANFDGSNMEHLAFRENILIQDTLGRLGIGPKFYGFIRPSEMRVLADRFEMAGNIKLELGFQRSAVALLSENIVGGWNFMRSSKKIGRIPSWFSTWPIERLDAILERMLRIEKFVSVLRIFPDDPQFLLQSTGRLMLFDFDFYRYRFQDYPERQFKSEMNKLVVKWEEATGQSYPAARFRRLTGHDKIVVRL